MRTILLGGVNAYIRQISTAGLGDHSYLVVAGDQAALVDPQRDTERFEDQLTASGARLVAVLETHVHNDYVTGGAVLAARHGAEYVVPAQSELAVPHHAIADGDDVQLGTWRLAAMHTPGHTPSHTSYALTSPEGRVAVFSGGSMLVGAVGRTDLVSEDLTERLTRLQYGSVRSIAKELPDPAWVAPTHGAGSFCAAGRVQDTVSTIEEERHRNPALLAESEDAFVREQLAGRTLYPAYYRHMAPINRQGPRPLALRPVPYCTPAELDAANSDAWIVDVRDARAFASAHIPGSLNIPAGNDAATYIGWVVPWGAPLVLVTDGAHELSHLRVALARIGIESVSGAVVDGLAAWRAGGHPTASYRVVTFADLHRERPASVLDVRDPIEHAAAALPGARNLHVSRVLDNPDDVPAGQVWVHCASGYRAALGASLVERIGRQPVLVLDSFDNAHA